MKKKQRKKRKKKNNVKDFFQSEKFLLIVFCVMLVVVLILGVLAIIKYEKEKNEIIANMVIPIKKDSNNFHFSISAKALEEKKKYYFKVTNYQEDSITDSSLNYHVSIENPSKSVISLVKEGSLKELMLNQEHTDVYGNHFSKEKKEEDLFCVEMVSYDELEENDYIRVEIVNEEKNQE